MQYCIRKVIFVKGDDCFSSLNTTMDTHSKNVCIIGVLHILYYTLFSVEPLFRAIRKFESVESDENSASYDIIFSFAVVGFKFIMAILAGLMIRGVFKQRHLLMAPFFILSSLELAVLCFIVLWDVFVGIYFEDFLYAIGVQITVLYPIFTLFIKLRFKSIKEKSIAKTSSEHEEKANDLLASKMSV